MRLKSLIAIYDNDAALAGKIKAEQEAADAAKKLADSMLAAALQISYSAGLASFKQAEINSLTQGPMPTPLTQAPQTVPQSPLESFRQNEARYANYSGNSGSAIIVNVAGSVTTERDLVSAITQGIYNNQASGIPINYSTSYV
jgi:hypothetical protein